MKTKTLFALLISLVLASHAFAATGDVDYDDLVPGGATVRATSVRGAPVGRQPFPFDKFVGSIANAAASFLGNQIGINGLAALARAGGAVAPGVIARLAGAAVGGALTSAITQYLIEGRVDPVRTGVSTVATLAGTFLAGPAGALVLGVAADLIYQGAFGR